MKRILITGANGQVGWELQRTLATFGTVFACDRQQFDLCKPDKIVELIRHFSPDIIINAAAYTSVDRAESEASLAMQINALAPGIMAEEAKRLGALLVHFSSDYVFDGESKYPYVEEDFPNPINVYGKSKLAGEENIQAVRGKYLILRTSWVYGRRGNNFLLTMLKLAESKNELKVVADQVGAPTWSRLLAEATAQILVAFSDRQSNEQLIGIYHLTASGKTSWHGFAEEIFSSQITPRAITAIRSQQYPSSALRPAYSLLSNKKIEKAFGIVMPSWQKSLKLCLDF